MKIFTLAMILAASISIAAQTNTVDVSKVTFLTGCWERVDDKPGRKTLEQWSSPAGGTLFGVGRTFSGDKLVSWEFMRIEQSGTSAKFLAQLPGATSATAFELKTATPTELTFENLKNDFPHRVIYRTLGKPSLAARIEGSDADEKKGVDFSFRRVGCE